MCGGVLLHTNHRATEVIHQVAAHTSKACHRHHASADRVHDLVSRSAVSRQVNIKAAAAPTLQNALISRPCIRTFW